MDGCKPMILGGSMARKANLSEDRMTGFIMFPLVVHALDCLVSAAGIMSIGGRCLDSSPSQLNLSRF